MSVTTFAIWFLWAALAYVACVLIATIFFGMRDLRRFAAYSLCPGNLLRRGHHGGHILFTHKRTGRYIRFRKYIHITRGYGIELTFPETRWGREYVPKLRAYCEDNGLAMVPATDEGEADHVCVDFGKDADRAWDLARTIWTEIFGLTERAACKFESHDLLEFDDLVDRPDYSRPPASEALEGRMRDYQRYRRDHESEIGYRFSGMFAALYFWIAATSRFVSYVGLPVATLLSVGDPPDWSAHLGPVDLGGETVSLAFFLMYLVSFAVLMHSKKRLQKPDAIRRENTFGRLFNKLSPLHRLFRYGIPIAVVLIWAGA